MKPKSPRKGKSRSKASPAGEATIPLDQVQALIDLLEERGLEEFELEGAGLRIRIKRQGTGAPAVEASVNPGARAPGAAVVESRSEEAQAEAAAEMGVPAEEVHIVKSPIVGTFYAAREPGAPPFVQVGDRVEVGQVLCIIEAMKLMNEIEADAAGEVVRVYVENAQPVEYGEPLFALRPATKT